MHCAADGGYKYGRPAKYGRIQAVVRHWGPFTCPPVRRLPSTNMFSYGYGTLDACFERGRGAVVECKSTSMYYIIYISPGRPRQDPELMDEKKATSKQHRAVCHLE